ncbi:MAG: MBL fold metallo-hydrolase [Candidatus Magasanikbacteria bacterium]|nr:MBL fold metallo-hydrolase [Candidatus Magasanikbacteria bacterium]
MKITKFGHSCLLVEEKGARILFDPGNYSTVPALEKLDAILITHVHQDHADVPTLKKLIALNPRARIFSNEEVVAALAKEGIEVDKLGDKEQVVVQNVVIDGVGEWHAKIYEKFPVVKNTGYCIADRLFYPGDALTVPDKTVEILAYPAVAPWMKISEALDYLKLMKPKAVFPVHDGFLKFGGPYHNHPERHAKEWGIRWVVLEHGQPQEF